jgi:flagellar biosynthesis protein FlhG
MKDQADGLRLKLRELQQSPAKTAAVISGKGGVGKSNISVNLAVVLAQLGKKVLLFDLDIGMANIHILSGISADRSIADFIEKHYELEDLIVPCSGGFSYIFGGSGLGRLLEWSEQDFQRWIDSIAKLQWEYDYILFDMGAGASKESLELLMSVEDLIVVTTPEPTAVTDAYSMMKYIHMRDQDKHFYLICNRAESNKEGQETLERIAAAMQKFLNKEVSRLGILPEDKLVKKAVTSQTPFFLYNPHASVSRSLKSIVEIYLSKSNKTGMIQKNHFIGKLRQFFWKGSVGNG